MRSSQTPARPESRHAETTAVMPISADCPPWLAVPSAMLGDCTSTMPQNRMPSASHLRREMWRFIIVTWSGLGFG